MTLTRKTLDNRYAWWFHGKRKAERAKEEILSIFSQEPDDGGKWTEQDIYNSPDKS